MRTKVPNKLNYNSTLNSQLSTLNSQLSTLTYREVCSCATAQLQT
ncbi:MAG: hypothetical protein ACRC62_08350 [Microcoleus sp.]